MSKSAISVVVMLWVAMFASACMVQPMPAASSEQILPNSANEQMGAQSAQPMTPEFGAQPPGQIGAITQGYQMPDGPSYGSPEGSYAPYGGAPVRRTPPGQPFIYPNKGQSQQQLQLDKGQCYTWAVEQSGFDPANPPPPTAPPPSMGPPQGGVFQGAAGGAALGAIGGAIGGDAGKGAAMGAAMGGVFGGMRRRQWVEESQYQQQAYVSQQQNILNQGRSNYKRAFGACMQGRGYTLD